MTKRKLYLALALSIIFIICVSLFSCGIQNPKLEECDIVTAQITKITEGSTYDIVFHVDETHSFYINRGIEYGLNLDSLNVKVLNKTVTLHLPILIYGTSKHIAQLAVDDEIIFTEFSSI
ncbi:hypothetical protein [Psychroserpens damuponensis]|uniref:hypothetical protein n=1 Tax=Psychroserpens damuponensis TaxID=943936 RepID=UPI00058ADF5C|nr:hypothetical protein [Psychroserpens damuponensis]